MAALWVVRLASQWFVLVFVHGLRLMLQGTCPHMSENTLAKASNVCIVVHLISFNAFLLSDNLLAGTLQILCKLLHHFLASSSFFFLYTGFLCMFSNPLASWDLLPDVPVAVQGEGAKHCKIKKSS
jgi:hypothetical protein